MKKVVKIIPYLLFSVVFAVYAFSVSSTINFWDSSEFITSNYHLQSTHPPGAPFYTLLCNAVMMFFPASYTAIISNLISAFFGALTVVMLYKTTNLLTIKLFLRTDSAQTKLVAILSGLISALTLSFSTTFWSVAIEAEVYTLSSFLLLLTFYLMLLWNFCKDSLQSKKIFLTIIFVLGVSLSVHLINLSVIIPLSVLYVYKKNGSDWKFLILGLICSVLFFLIIFNFGIQGFLKVSSALDIKLVNDFGFPVNSGLFILIIFIVFLVSYGLFKSHNRQDDKLNFTILAVLMFVIGASSYLIPILRNKVKTPFSYSVNSSNELSSYIKAKQFGVDNIPLIKGAVFNAPLDKENPFLNKAPIKTYDSEFKKYITSDDGKYSKINYAHEFDMFFPRMYSQKQINANGYSNWVAIKGENVKYPVQGKETDLLKPTFSENLQFFKNYQVEWMYLRYLFWNFIGKQNDIKGTGDAFNGNWISGFDSFDKNRVGKAKLIPEGYQHKNSNDVYYFLPFILGLIGIWSLRNYRVYLICSVVFFLTFGMGIVIYLNPLPESILVRERDYIFLGSFIIFSMWIGLSIITLYKWLSKIKSEKIRIGIVSVVVIGVVPFQLLAKNWDNHQNRNETFAYQLAKTYLNSCPANTILITNGDNFSFPLWYLQEVEKFREDVRVVNFDQLNLESYIDKLKQQSLLSSPIKMNFSKKNYIEGRPKLFPLQKQTNQPIDLAILTQFLNNEKTNINWNGKLQHYVPGDVFSISFDTTKTVFENFNSQKLKAKFHSKIAWKYSNEFYQLKDLILLNIIQNNVNERPICFAVNGQYDHYIGLQDFLVHKGFVEQLVSLGRTQKELNSKIVDSKMMFKLIIENNFFTSSYNNDLGLKPEDKEYIQTIVRRNYYFLTQALIEEGENNKAKIVLDNCFNIFPDKVISYKQFAFALGKLYYRIGMKREGDEVCKKAMNNVKTELYWITSFNPNNPIINVKKAVKLKEMYEQMIFQIEPFNSSEFLIRKKEAERFQEDFIKWKNKNWPY